MIDTQAGNRCLALLLLAHASIAQEPPRLAGQLSAGLELVYSSNGTPQPPWSIDSIQQEAAGPRASHCVAIHLRRSPSQSSPEINRLCLAHDTLYGWHSGEQRWKITRPTGPEMTWVSVQANGDSVRYETGPASVDSVAGLAIPVVQTTVTTVDSLGRPKRRLRERYAVSLATATQGLFESPDSSKAGEWLPRTRFELREIRGLRKVP